MFSYFFYTNKDLFNLPHIKISVINLNKYGLDCKYIKEILLFNKILFVLYNDLHQTKRNPKAREDHAVYVCERNLIERKLL